MPSVATRCRGVRAADVVVAARGRRQAARARGAAASASCAALDGFGRRPSARRAPRACASRSAPGAARRTGRRRRRPRARRRVRLSCPTRSTATRRRAHPRGHSAPSTLPDGRRSALPKLAVCVPVSNAQRARAVPRAPPTRRPRRAPRRAARRPSPPAAAAAAAASVRLVELDDEESRRAAPEGVRADVEGVVEEDERVVVAELLDRRLAEERREDACCTRSRPRCPTARAAAVRGRGRGAALAALVRHAEVRVLAAEDPLEPASCGAP